MFECVEFRLRQHLLNPDDVAAFLVELGEGGFDIFHDFRRVGSAGAQNDLDVRVHEVQCLKRYGDPFDG